MKWNHRSLSFHFSTTQKSSLSVMTLTRLVRGGSLDKPTEAGVSQSFL